MILIFLLIGIVLIILNINKINIEKEKSFLTVISEKENNVDETKLEIGKIRKNMGESLTDLQLEIDELRDQVAYLKFKIGEMEKKNFSKEKNIEEKIEISYNNIEDIEENVINNINYENISKKEKIKKLILNGVPDEEICQKLKANKGEVLLIRGLLK